MAGTVGYALCSLYVLLIFFCDYTDVRDIFLMNLLKLQKNK